MITKFKILAVDDNVHSLKNFELGLKNDNYSVEIAAGYEEAVGKLDRVKFNLLVTDLKMPYKDGLDLADYALSNQSVDDVILVTGFGDEESVERAIKIGVKDFIRKPYQQEEFALSVDKIYRNFLLREENEELRKKLKLENEILRKQIQKKDEDEFKIIGKSKLLEAALRKAEEIAKYSETCLILGESGTGKELLARYIHRNGPRRNKPFIALNCAEISPSLFESELFGYSKGSFTGAVDNAPGLFEVADKGILFLDEISEIPLGLQAKLLRVLENNQIRRVGDNSWRTIDVQIIASSNRTADELINGNILRKDLFHRLNSSSIILPPLRDRIDDIKPLFLYYHQKYSNIYDKNSDLPDAGLMKKLKKAEWQGNIRQFSNFVRNYVLFGEINSAADFDLWINNGTCPNTDELNYKFRKGTIEELKYAKYWLVNKILKKYNYNKSKTARHLGMTYPGLSGLMKAMGIDNDE